MCVGRSKNIILTSTPAGFLESSRAVEAAPAPKKKVAPKKVKFTTADKKADAEATKKIALFVQSKPGINAFRGILIYLYRNLRRAISLTRRIVRNKKKKDTWNERSDISEIRTRWFEMTHLADDLVAAVGSHGTSKDEAQKVKHDIVDHLKNLYQSQAWKKAEKLLRDLRKRVFFHRKKWAKVILKRGVSTMIRPYVVYGRKILCRSTTPFLHASAYHHPRLYEVVLSRCTFLELP